jgi:putative ABC transport system substrate-binding protein
MRRRGAIAVLGAAALAAVLPCAAQPAGRRTYRIGLLGVPAPEEYAAQLAAFKAGLRALGWIEGTNVSIESRWANGRIDRLPALAAELVALKPDMLVTSGPGSVAAKRATGTIPIVMAAAGDAAESGLVESLAHPGGNVTGLSFFLRELNAKRLELLKETLPRLARVGVLMAVGGSDALKASLIGQLKVVAGALRLSLTLAEAKDAADLERAFASLAKAGAEALTVTDHTMLVAEAPGIAALAARRRMPAAGFAQIAMNGGLLAYGVDFPALWGRAASYVDRILKGARPADLPVEQPTKFELLVNATAAKAIGVRIPQSVLLRADRVIE